MRRCGVTSYNLLVVVVLRVREYPASIDLLLPVEGLIRRNHRPPAPETLLADVCA